MSVPGNTTQRGYGYTHQQQRKRWAPTVQRGEVICARYGQPGYPDCPGLIHPGQAWDLGHDDWDRTVYTGPEHMQCNRRAGALKARGKSKARGTKGRRVTSLRW